MRSVRLSRAVPSCGDFSLRRAELRAPLRAPALGALIFLASGIVFRSTLNSVNGASSIPMAAATFDSRPKVFIVGNEAADVDSLVSAYAMAQLLNSSEVQAIALAQIPREEFHLRGDAVSLFRDAAHSKVLADGSPVEMMFWDEVPWDKVDHLDSRSLVLVDHNRMTDPVAAHFEAHRVRQVLDHHAGGISYPDASNIIDESLGSCASLVVEQFARLKPPEALTPELGVLMAGAILLDCRNFDKDAKKGTLRDIEALKHLKSSVKVPEEGPWYKQLMDARKEVGHLSVRDLMLLDTKVVTLRSLRVAVCSMFCTITEVCSKAGSSEEVANIAKGLAMERGYDAVILLFSKDKSMGKRRALAFIPMDVSGDTAATLLRDIVRGMLGTPHNLPEELKSNPLYQTQGLVETGFQLEELKKLQPLEVYSLKGDVSRKTVLPFAHHASMLLD